MVELSNQSIAEPRRAALEREQWFLTDLRRRLDILIVDGAGPVVIPSQAQAGPLEQILCEWAASTNPNVVCHGSAPSLLARLSLLALSEHSRSGSILAVLIITAAIGGALVRLSFASETGRDALPTLLRAVGGGIVCYLAIGGNNLLLSAGDLAKYSNPATASLAGFLSGMFSDRVFRLVSELVDALVTKLRPASGQSAQETHDEEGARQGRDGEPNGGRRTASDESPRRPSPSSTKGAG